MRSSLLVLLLFFPLFTNAIMCKDILHTQEVIKNPNIEKSLQILELLKTHGLINEKKYKHAKEDIEAGLEQIKKKKGNPAFDEILGKWEKHLENSLQLNKKFLELPLDEQKVWKEKLETYLFFGVGHFVTFLESSDKKVYKKINSILDHMNSLDVSDPKIIMFEFEKQVMRFFSKKEFKRCKF